jgi:hypothetical protein
VPKRGTDLALLHRPRGLPANDRQRLHVSRWPRCACTRAEIDCVLQAELSDASYRDMHVGCSVIWAAMHRRCRSAVARFALKP